MAAYHLASLIAVQKASSNADQSFSRLFKMVHVILYGSLLDRFNNGHKLLSSFCFFLQSQLTPGNSKFWEFGDEGQDSESSNQSQENCFYNKRRERSVNREDVKMAMENLGLFCSGEGEELDEWMGSDKLSQLFDEKEPSLEEVKEAFDVFDHNSDGFIDAIELQRVFYKLGLKEGFELENCRKMIKTSDENEDGRLDFNEFVKFMENSFC